MHGCRRHVRMGLGAIALGVGLCGEAGGQEAAANADALFRQGRAELAAGDYASACDKLRRSDELEPAPGTKLNLGECEAQRGRVATAWRLFRAVEQSLEPKDIRLPLATSKREAVEKRLPWLVITLDGAAPRDTRIYLGSRELTAGEMAVPLEFDPGPMEVTVSSAAEPGYRLTALLEEGKLTRLVVVPPRPVGDSVVGGPKVGSPVGGPPIASSPVGGASPFGAPIAVATPPQTPVKPVAVAPSNAAPKPSSPTPLSPSREQAAAPNARATAAERAGSALLWSGVGVTALAGILGILTMDAKRVNDEHCWDSTQTCDDMGRRAASRGRWLGAMTTTSMIAGVVGIGLGAYLRFKDGPTVQSTTALKLSGGASGMELGLTRSF